MSYGYILTGIWSGDYSPRQDGSVAREFLKQAAALPLDTVFLLGTRDEPVRVMPAGEELEPGLSLADILAEEFDLFVQDDTLVILPQPPADGSWKTATPSGMAWLEPPTDVPSKLACDVHQL